jgi:hypothetical protein
LDAIISEDPDCLTLDEWLACAAETRPCATCQHRVSMICRNAANGG